MNNQNLIIYKFSSLYQILKELENSLNLSVFEAQNEEILEQKIKSLNNYLIISRKKLLSYSNQYIFDHSPLTVLKFIEKINIEFLKKNFIEQSEINIKNYILNLNARTMSIKNLSLKLTEKEINTIIYLFNTKKPVTVDELQTKVWGYQSEIETHTVETHIYRLRKKIQNIFKDDQFLISKKNGYQII